MLVIKDEWDHFEEKFAKMLQIFLSKLGSAGTFLRDPDLIWPKGFGTFRICTTTLLENYERF
jgi:hypothetical protein